MTDRIYRTGWRALLEWALAFGLLALTLIGAASIGLFIAPFAIAAVVLAVRRNRDWPEAALGGLAGVGAVCLFIAYRSRNYSPCPPTETTVRLARGGHFSCDGLDPVPWLTIGVALVGVGLAGYLAFRQTQRRGTT